MRRGGGGGEEDRKNVIGGAALGHSRIDEDWPLHRSETLQLEGRIQFKKTYVNHNEDMKIVMRKPPDGMGKIEVNAAAKLSSPLVKKNNRTSSKLPGLKVVSAPDNPLDRHGE